MHQFSRLAGTVKTLARNQKYTVGFVSLVSKDQVIYRVGVRFLAYGALLVTAAFALVLFQPSHWVVSQQPTSSTYIGNLVMLMCLVALQIFAILGTISATRSTLMAKDPIPVRPLRGLRVAFVTTRAPGEPIEMVNTTLRAAKRIRYAGGTKDVWLLDETRDPQLIAMCKELEVKYFSRQGVAEWNTVKPKRRWLASLLAIVTKRETAQTHNPFLAARSKHGNFNAWMSHLDTANIHYDILAGVDTDQVPEINYLERLLGYFRDKDVAYVVGPQVYGNYGPGLKGLVARWAESQASFFQSTIQRAGNDSQSAMFVGTNYALRLDALKQVGGFQPCITEDMATGLAIHTNRNPNTGNRWKSVYTPDVLARGEGPNFWAPYFTQQWRWAAGTFDTWRRVVWRVFFRLSPKAMIHYFLILTYYPISALTWLLAIISSMTYLLTGSTAIIAPWGQFISLYAMTLVLQLSLYFWSRQYNVSPHEQAGTYGVPGMLLSSLTAPIYLSALIGVLIGKTANFVVTTKGASDNPDWFPAFRTHIQWALLLASGIVFGLLHKHAHPAMLLWVGVLLILCLTPLILGMSLAISRRLQKSGLGNRLVSEEISNV